MAVCISFPVIDMVRTGENIRRLRQERDIRVRELQQFLGLAGPQAIYQWERGVSLPSVDHLCALSHLFGVTMNEILVLRPVQTEEEKTPQPVRKLAVIKRILQLLAA